MQLHRKYSVITNQTLHNFFVNSSNVSVMNVSCLLSLNWVYTTSTSCSNTRSKSLSKWQDLPYQWTAAANRSISTARQSSDRQWWTVLACVSDSVPASRHSGPTHDYPMDWDLCIRLKYQPGYFMPESQLN